MKQKSNKHITISVWDGIQKQGNGNGREGGRERFVYSEGSTTLISSSFALLIRKQIFWIKMNIQ
jgi:hypothetical protein